MTYLLFFFNQPFNAQFCKLSCTCWLANSRRFDARGVIHSEFDLPAPQINTGLLKMNVGVLTTCHTQYTGDRSI